MKDKLRIYRAMIPLHATGYAPRWIVGLWGFTPGMSFSSWQEALAYALRTIEEVRRNRAL